MSDGAKPPLEIRDLVKRYDTLTAVNGVSFEVPRGRVFCLVGPNGAGKTTTLSIAQGLRRPTSGTARLFGVDPLKMTPALKKRIGVLPQSYAAFDSHTVRENLEYVAGIYDVRPDIDALLESLGLADKAEARYRTLSGGMMRRVGIAAALVNDPDLIFLDEPTSGVDPANRRKLWDVILRLRREGRSIVLTTHYMDEAERLSDEVAIIYRGQIAARGPPERVRLDHGGGTIIRVRGLAGTLPPALAARAGVHVGEDGVISIPLASAAEGPVVIGELVRSGTHYEELSIREPNLDDAFVRLVAEREA